MPTYEYLCDACGEEFEREQRISEDPIKKCPKCGKAKARRLIGAGNFILKGGGWYSDLYSGPSNKNGKKDTKSETPSSSTSSSEPSAPASSEKKKKAVAAD